MRDPEISDVVEKVVSCVPCKKQDENDRYKPGKKAIGAYFKRKFAGHAYRLAIRYKGPAPIFRLPMKAA